ncbi:MAG TPA: helix-turn-helix domain-containing protein [Thermoleophilaceae bacterium]|nr:helix-turn-helix domain-containing protein [Thermoleophilaceae bacterium]
MAPTKGQTGGAGLLDALGAVSAAVSGGAGLPEAARALSRALDLSVAVVDAAGGVLAVACASPDDERAVLALERGAESVPLTAGGATVGELRLRARDVPPPDEAIQAIATLIALEVERSRGPERAAGEAVATLLADLLDRRLTDRENIVARANELGADLREGAAVIVARARPLHPEEGDWRTRVLTLAERGARGVAAGALAACVERMPNSRWTADHDAANHLGEIVIVVPGTGEDAPVKVADAVRRELEANLYGYTFAVARSRPAQDPADLHRAGAEALLAANVAEARGETLLAFEDTGAYRLLLPAMSEDPAELHRFYQETLAPLVAYDEQYETELVRTLETFLDENGNVAQTAERLFTHRHTIRYRLDRVRDLSGLDVSSTDGRERLGLGLKAMRVLGIAQQTGPALEPGASAGRVPREGKER